MRDDFRFEVCNVTSVPQSLSSARISIRAAENGESDEASMSSPSCIPSCCFLPRPSSNSSHEHVRLQVFDPCSSKKLLLHMPRHGAANWTKPSPGAPTTRRGFPTLHGTHAQQGPAWTTMFSGGAMPVPWACSEMVAHDVVVRSSQKSAAQLHCAVKAYWSSEHPGTLLLAASQQASAATGAPVSSGSDGRSPWVWQALSLSAQFDMVSAVACSQLAEVSQSEGMDRSGPAHLRPPLISSVLLEIHPEGVLVAAVVGDSEGRSCVLFLTSGLQPLRHVVWCNFEASAQSGLHIGCPHRVQAATWLAGMRCLALVDSCSNIGLIEHTGRLVQVEVSTRDGTLIPGLSQIPFSGLANVSRSGDARGQWDGLDRFSLSSLALTSSSSGGGGERPQGNGSLKALAPATGEAAALVVSDGQTVVLLAYTAPPLPPLLLVDTFSLPLQLVAFSSMPRTTASTLAGGHIKSSGPATSAAAASAAYHAGAAVLCADDTAATLSHMGGGGERSSAHGSSPALILASHPESQSPEVELVLAAIRASASLCRAATGRGDMPGISLSAAANSSPAGSFASPAHSFAHLSLNLMTMPPSPLAAKLVSQHLFSPLKLLKVKALAAAGTSDRISGWPIVHKSLNTFATIRGDAPSSPGLHSSSMLPGFLTRPGTPTAAERTNGALEKHRSYSLGHYACSSTPVSTSQARASPGAGLGTEPPALVVLERQRDADGPPSSSSNSSSGGCPLVMDADVYAQMLLGDAALLDGRPVEALSHFIQGGVFGFLPCLLVLLHHLQLKPCISLLRSFASFVSSQQLHCDSGPQGPDLDPGCGRPAGCRGSDPRASPTLQTSLALHRQCGQVLASALVDLVPETAASPTPSVPQPDLTQQDTQRAVAGGEVEALLRACQQQLVLGCQCLALLSNQLHLQALQLQRQVKRRFPAPQQAALGGTTPTRKTLRRTSLGLRVVSLSNSSPAQSPRAHASSTNALPVEALQVLLARPLIVGMPMPIVWHDVSPAAAAVAAPPPQLRSCPAADHGIQSSSPALVGALHGRAMEHHQPPQQQPHNRGDETGTSGCPPRTSAGLCVSTTGPGGSGRTCVLGLFHTALDVARLMPASVVGLGGVTTDWLESVNTRNLERTSGSSDKGPSHSPQPRLPLPEPCPAPEWFLDPALATGLLLLSYASETAGPRASLGDAATSIPRHSPENGTASATTAAAAAASPAPNRAARLNWRLLHDYPPEACGAGMWSGLGDWRKAAVLAFAVHQTAAAKCQQVRPSGGGGGGGCLNVGLRILRQQVARCDGMEVQEACITLHELVAIPRHVLGQRSPVYGIMLRKVCHKLADLLPKRVGITPLLAPLTSNSALLMHFCHQDIRIQLRYHLGKGLAKVCGELLMAMGCGGAPTAVIDMVQVVLADIEIQACLKMLLRWQGCYDVDKLDQGARAACESYDLNAGEPADWDSHRLLECLEEALALAQLVPAADLRVTMQLARAALMEMQRSAQRGGGRGSASDAEEELPGSPDRPAWGGPRGEPAATSPKATVPDDSKPGLLARTPPDLVDPNDLALLVDFAQTGGTLLSCIQPHVGDALPALEAQLADPTGSGGGGRSSSGWLRLSSLLRPVEGDVAVGPEAEEASVDEIRAAVAELLRQLVTLDWAMTCRTRVATLLSQLSQVSQSLLGDAPTFRKPLLNGRFQRASVSFTFRKVRSPSETKRRQQLESGVRVAQLQSDLLQWCAALLDADSYHVDTELQATVHAALVASAGTTADAVWPQVPLVISVELSLRRRNLFNAKLAEQINRLKKAGQLQAEGGGDRRGVDIKRDPMKQSAPPLARFAGRQLSAKSAREDKGEALEHSSPASLRKHLNASILAGLQSFAGASKAPALAPLVGGPSRTLRHHSLLLCMLDTLVHHPSHFTGGAVVTDELGELLKQDLHGCFVHPLRPDKQEPGFSAVSMSAPATPAPAATLATSPAAASAASASPTNWRASAASHRKGSLSMWLPNTPSSPGNARSELEALLDASKWLKVQQQHPLAHAACQQRVHATAATAEVRRHQHLAGSPAAAHEQHACQLLPEHPPSVPLSPTQSGEAPEVRAMSQVSLIRGLGPDRVVSMQDLALSLAASPAEAQTATHCTATHGTATHGSGALSHHSMVSRSQGDSRTTSGSQAGPATGQHNDIAPGNGRFAMGEAEAAAGAFVHLLPPQPRSVGVPGHEEGRVHLEDFWHDGAELAAADADASPTLTSAYGNGLRSAPDAAAHAHGGKAQTINGLLAKGMHVDVPHDQYDASSEFRGAPVIEFLRTSSAVDRPQVQAPSHAPAHLLPPRSGQQQQQRPLCQGLRSVVDGTGAASQQVPKLGRVGSLTAGTAAWLHGSPGELTEPSASDRLLAAKTGPVKVGCATSSVLGYLRGDDATDPRGDDSGDLKSALGPPSSGGQPTSSMAAVAAFLHGHGSPAPEVRQGIGRNSAPSPEAASLVGRAHALHVNKLSLGNARSRSVPLEVGETETVRTRSPMAEPEDASQAATCQARPLVAVKPRAVSKPRKAAFKTSNPLFSGEARAYVDSP